mmetsp:Transcript_10380/g.25629  ORF Transcript_10380/g.25629 Transcript_10380/m.25629 type:complete len:200 (+) Transcript_10380:629-1228(+)
MTRSLKAVASTDSMSALMWSSSSLTLEASLIRLTVWMLLLALPVTSRANDLPCCAPEPISCVHWLTSFLPRSSSIVLRSTRSWSSVSDFWLVVARRRTTNTRITLSSYGSCSYLGLPTISRCVKGVKRISLSPGYWDTSLMSAPIDILPSSISKMMLLRVCRFSGSWPTPEYFRATCLLVVVLMKPASTPPLHPLSSRM